MSRCPGEPPSTAMTQTDVYLFERPEETGEGLFEVNRPAARLAEILRPELILARDNRRSQWPVFVRALRPCEVRFPVDPQSKSHVSS